MEEKVLEASKKSIQNIIKEGIATTNIDNLGKLVDIYKDIKEVESMNYGEYNGRGPGHGSYGRDNYGEYNRGYGEYNNGYGRRGVDSKYRGYGHLDRMYNEYGNYSYGRERYGANEDTKRSLEYMLRSMEDFARMLKEEASSQEEVQMIRETAQRIAQM